MRSTFTTTTRTSFLSIIALLLITTVFTSCSKKGDVVAEGTGYIRIVNGSPTTSPIDLYVDDAKKNNAALEYNQGSDYFALKTGEHQATIKTSASGTTVASFVITPSANTYYTIFYFDNITAAYPDDTSVPKAGKARVRFINLNLGLTGNVDFGLSGGDKLASNLVQGQASDYVDVAPGSTFAIYNAGVTTALLTIPTTIEGGHIYTVYVTGDSTPNLVAAVNLQK